MKFSLLFLLLTVLSCSHLPEANLAKSLFPAANYQQDLQVTIVDSNQTYNFLGVVGLSEHALKIYLIGPMDMSMLKISESFVDNKFSIENYFAPLKPYESYLKDFYPLLRSFLLYDKNKKEWGSLKVIERTSEGNIRKLSGPHDLIFEIKKYQKNHPVLFEIQHPRFRVLVKDREL